jgi:predicted NBD/HSP70 family sugar kinase
VFVGTGVGGGLILDGRPYEGGSGGAGEFGHLVVRQGGATAPGSPRGSVEAYAGRRAIELAAQRARTAGTPTILFDVMEEKGKPRVTSGVLKEAYDRGDPLVADLLDDAIEALGAGIASAVNLLDVDRVVLGGGSPTSSVPASAPGSTPRCARTCSCSRPGSSSSAPRSVTRAGAIGAALLAAEAAERAAVPRRTAGLVRGSRGGTLPVTRWSCRGRSPKEFARVPPRPRPDPGRRARRRGRDRHLAPRGGLCVDGRISTALIDEQQSVAYDLASVASAVARPGTCSTGASGARPRRCWRWSYAADVAVDLKARASGREAAWGLPADLLVGEAAAIAAGRDPGVLDDLAERVLATGEAGGRHLPEDLEMVRQTFRRFAEDKVAPIAEHVHRHDEDIPEDVIKGLAELGCFALSIPEEHGGFASGGEDELLNMVLVTEELSRGSLGVAGSLITRPEIIGTAILKGGTEEQKARWLPPIAAGEKMCGVAVTEPDYGSDVAGVKVTARRDGDDWVIDGVKTWCTFAGRAEYLLVLARTDPDRSLGHRG